MGSDTSTKLKIGAICSICFIIISYLIFRTSLSKLPNIFLYNIVIVLTLQGLGFYRGLFFLGGVVFLTILLSISTSFYYVWNVPVFFITFLIVDDQLKKSGYTKHIIGTRIEEIKENINLLTDEYNRHKKEAMSLQKKAERYNALKDIISVLNSTVLIEDVTRYVMDNAFCVVGKADLGLLFLVDTKKQELNLVISKTESNFEKVKTKKGDILDEWVFKHRQGLLVEDIKKDFRFSEDRFEKEIRPFRSIISCPLMIERKVIGILRLESFKPYSYNSEDLRLLDIISDLGAVSLENAGLYKQTLDLAIRDGLTGLYLRRYFLERLKEEMSRSLRDDLECSFLMIDIDNFKNYNDRYGHMAGDILLKSISNILKDFVPSGIVGRYGGEEFSVLLPEASKKEALRIADNIRKAIKKNPVSLRRVETYVTVSVGVACFPEDAKVLDELILKADERLYKAKREGKDRVVGDVGL